MKRVVILTIGVFVFAMDRIRDLACRLLGIDRPGRCVVIYYHAVSERQRAGFEKQMDALVRWAVPTSAERIVPLPAGKNCVVVTFDDAYRNTLANAFPILRAKGIPSTIFAVPKMLGHIPELRDSSTNSDEDRMVMSAEELQSLAGDLVTIGSHSLSHPFLPRSQPQEAIYELSESKRILEELLHQPVDLFCFPYGAYTEDLISLCRQAGYERVFTTLPRWAFSDPNEFVTGRVRVDPTDGLLEFHLKAVGAYRWLPAFFALKRRILGQRSEGPVSPAFAADR